MLVCAFLLHIAHGTAGAARTRHSLRPLTSEGEAIWKTSRANVRRERRHVSVPWNFEFMVPQGKVSRRARAIAEPTLPHCHRSLPVGHQFLPFSQRSVHPSSALSARIVAPAPIHE